MEKICSRCQTGRLKIWDELTSEEKFVAERLPHKVKFSKAERKHHLFCTKCWNEVNADETRT